MIEAKIICDSLNPFHVRLTTFVLTYPRFIHSEFMTHRCFSRNAASSRAIPIQKSIDRIMRDSNMVEWWGANESGMQANAEILQKNAAMMTWAKAAGSAVAWAERLHELGLHKQIVNRVLEPFLPITVVATADNFGLANFFALRAHPAAQPEFQMLAYKMLKAYVQDEPRKIDHEDWHLPFIQPEEMNQLRVHDLLQVASARCARVSYLNHEGKRSLEDDLKLFEKLRSGSPPHASAFEHCARAVSQVGSRWDDQVSNFHPSWYQYRKSIPRETTNAVDLERLLNDKPDWIKL